MRTTGVVEHEIPIGDAQPIRKPLYRTPYALREEMQRQVQKMLERNIRKNSSPWVAPAILVPKKISDGKPKFRFCVDFRALNAVTKFDPYPLPRFDETNSTLFGSKYFTFLDCYSGFWQINVRDNTRSEPHSLSPQVTMSLIDYPLVCLTAPLTSKDSWTWC